MLRIWAWLRAKWAIESMFCPVCGAAETRHDGCCSPEHLAEQEQREAW